jgi:hypothetical protein
MRPACGLPRIRHEFTTHSPLIHGNQDIDSDILIALLTLVAKDDK